jgi:hypothetical protein
MSNILLPILQTSAVITLVFLNFLDAGDDTEDNDTSNIYTEYASAYLQFIKQ